MEAVSRKPYQVVSNIIRFNWHFYVIAGVSVLLILSASIYVGDLLFWFLVVLALGIVASTCISLLTSYYVYDRSCLYDFTWLSQFEKSKIKRIVNVHAGFDETSVTLNDHFQSAEISVYDFYDPSKHTEVSIERARKAYPAYDGTIRVTTSELPMQDKVLILSLIFLLYTRYEAGTSESGFYRNRFGRCAMMAK